MPLDIEGLTQLLREFRDARDWSQFHNAKDLALGLSVEASELVETFLWKAPEEVDRKRVEEELADVFLFVLLLTEKYGFDLEKIARAKIARNGEKYPVEKARGTARKYDEL
jgi:NTP pyrophosphatase (non-canonical NTP hydrolase)